MKKPFIFFLFLFLSFSAAQEQEKILRIVTKSSEPFVMKNGDKFTGFSIELLEKIIEEIAQSKKIKLKPEISEVETINELLNEVEKKKADVACAAISMTPEREEMINFTYPIFDGGFQIMVSKQTEMKLSDIFLDVIPALFSKDLMILFGLFFLSIFVAAHIIWFTEKDTNEDFPSNYFKGIWEAFWWASVTITTVGYGDKVPRGVFGRLFGLFWMFISLFLLAYFTATVTTKLTLTELRGKINRPEDLPGKQVATVLGSTADAYLKEHNIQAKRLKKIDDAYKALENQEIEAIVYDSPTLIYYAKHKGNGKVKVVGRIFHQESYGIALQTDSPYQELFNKAILKLKLNNTYQRLYQKYFQIESY